MKKFLVSLPIVAILFSCSQPASTDTTAVKAPVDSLISKWTDTWNNHDSVGVRNLFTQDALLIDDGLIAKNADEISAKWIHPYINVVNHFKATTIQEWSGTDRAGYTGRYEFDVIAKDSLMAKPTGLFTINWVKTEDGTWKIITATNHTVAPKM